MEGYKSTQIDTIYKELVAVEMEKKLVLYKKSDVPS